jgi:hypothetical protein
VNDDVLMVLWWKRVLGCERRQGREIERGRGSELENLWCLGDDSSRVGLGAEEKRKVERLEFETFKMVRLS